MIEAALTMLTDAIGIQQDVAIKSCVLFRLGDIGHFHGLFALLFIGLQSLRCALADSTALTESRLPQAAIFAANRGGINQHPRPADGLPSAEFRSRGERRQLLMCCH